MPAKISTEKPPKIDDNAFVNFILQHASGTDQRSHTSGKERTHQKFIEAKLGNLYLMKQKWDCEKLDPKFAINEGERCKEFQKFLDAIYEYFFQLFIKAKDNHLWERLPSKAKPEFLYFGKSEKAAKIGEILFILHKVFECYFDLKQSELNRFKVENVLIMYKRFALANASEFEQFLAFRRNDWAPFSGELSRKQKDFDEMLENAAQMTTEMTKNEIWTDIEHRSSDLSNVEIGNCQRCFDGVKSVSSSISDEMLFAIMRGQTIVFTPRVNAGLLMQRIGGDEMKNCKALLGIAYLMKLNWRCEKIDAKFEQYEQEECQRFREYADIVYEFLLRRNVQGESIGMPLFKGMHSDALYLWPMGIVDVLFSLSNIALFYFDPENSAKNGYKLVNALKDLHEPVLGKGILKDSNVTAKDREIFGKIVGNKERFLILFPFVLPLRHLIDFSLPLL